MDKPDPQTAGDAEMDKSDPKKLENSLSGASSNASLDTDTDSPSTGTSDATARAVPSHHDPAVIRQVYQVAVERRVNEKVLLAGFEAGWVESHMNNLSYGDRDSVGVFQQRPSQGWGTKQQCMNVRHASTSFFSRAEANDRKNPGYTAGRLAQSVQRSGFPDRYDQAEAKARALIAEARGKPPSTIDARAIRAAARGVDQKDPDFTDARQFMAFARVLTDGELKPTEAAWLNTWKPGADKSRRGTLFTYAIRVVQSRAKLKQDGIFGPQTAAFMERYGYTVTHIND
jgi:peptidoglycan hydrolase-like protein with peptidoglycan-binding domain